jgi:hypothetical protein
MSYDLTLIDSERPLSPDEAEMLAAELIEAVAVEDRAEPLTERVRGFVEEAEASFPPIEDDASPWAAPPEATGPVVGLNLRFAHAESAVPRIEEMAREQGLALFDPQSGDLIHPTAR